MSSALHILRNEAEYDAALAEYESYFDAEPPRGSEAADRFELLGLLLAKYEEARFPIVADDPVEIIREVMLQKGYRQSDLANLFGSRSRASELLSGRRDLTIPQMRKLHSEWGIPAESLLGI